MAVFVFVVPPFVGHIVPTISVGQRLEAQGHEVFWLGYKDPLDRLLPKSAQRRILDAETNPKQLENLRNRFYEVRGFEGLKFLWEEVLIPLAHHMYPGVLEVVEQLKPDVLITDQQTLAGAMVANQLEIKWATSATTPIDRVTALRPYPKVFEWTDNLIKELYADHGITPENTPEDSADLVISYYSEAFIGSREHYPKQYHFVGPSIDHRNENNDFPWDSLDDRPCVVISLGSLNAERDHSLFTKIIDAFSDEIYQVVIVAPPSLLSFPAQFIVRPWVPMLKLLQRTSVLITHAGPNTVCEAIDAGVPMVVVPILDSQPLVAKRVEEMGCGIRLSFKRSTADEIRQAVDRVTEEPSFRDNIQAMRRSFTEAGGSAQAATLLANLAK